MRLTTLYEGREYVYVEKGSRACLIEDGQTVWWGSADDAIPCDLVPLEPLLTLALLKEYPWKL